MKQSACSMRAAIALAFAAIPAVILIPTNVQANPLSPIWTGAYIGAHGGAVWSDLDVTDFGNINTSALTGGGHAGFNLGFGALVAGVEGDISANGSDLGFSTANGGTASLSSDWTGTIRGRVGLPVGPALLYATAGFAWTGTTLTEKSSAGLSASSSHTFGGVVYGVGAESYVLPNMSLRLEALRYDYGSDNLSITGAKNALQEFDPSETVVRAGVTFHLN